MRSFSVIFFILLTVGMLAFRFRQKQDAVPDMIDRLEQGIAGAQRLIPADGAFSLRLPGVREEYQCYTRYLMVPRQMYYPARPADTLLIISKVVAGTDTALINAAGSKNILWRNTDNQYNYTLVCGR